MTFWVVLALLQADTFELGPDKNVVFTDGTFKNGSAVPEPGFIKVLERFAVYLNKRPELCIEIGGHADNRGQPNANLRLSQARAEAVRRVLLDLKTLPADCLLAKGYGSSKPLDVADTDAARERNRRIEVVMLSKRSKTALHRAAELTAVVREVKTQAPWETEQKNGREQDPLFELHRVATAKQARAEVTFADDSKLQIDEDALVIIYGPSKDVHAPKSEDVKLMRGALLAKLQSMRGDALRVKTDTAVVTMKRGRNKLGVDDKKRSVLSVHEGRTTVSAQGADVAVEPGFGTQVEEGKQPEAPRPLPAAPKLLEPALARVELDAQGAIAARFSPTTRRTRVDVSRDEALNDLVHSQIVTGDVLRMQLPVGAYFLQLTALDDLDLESAPDGPPKAFSIVPTAQAQPASASKPLPQVVTEKATVAPAEPTGPPLTLRLDSEGPLSVTEEIFSITGLFSRQDAKVTVNDEPMIIGPARTFVFRTRLKVGDTRFTIVARRGAEVITKVVAVNYTHKLAIRAGFDLGPSIPVSFAGQTVALQLAGRVGFVVKPWLMPQLRAGLMLMLGAPVQPAFFADAGVVLELPVTFVLRPYAQLDLGVYGFTNNNYPEAASGRAKVAFAPVVGIGARVAYARVSFTLSAHYRLVLDSFTHRSIHGIGDLRLGIAFE